MSDSPTENLEHAEHAAHSGDRMLGRISVTIAVLAVVAATVGSFETIESGLAIADKNESVLLQNRASDAWAFFQAESIKKNLYDLASAETADAARKAAYASKARSYEQDSGTAHAQAADFERERDDMLAGSTGHESRHHVLTAALTLLHVSIAIATIAIILRGRRWPWYTAMLLGGGGVALAVAAYL